jgi:hypothetical protein
MKRKFWLYIASVLLIILGLLRGIGGFFLLVYGKNTQLDQPITASATQIRLVGLALILVFFLAILSSLLVIAYRSRVGWVLSWISLILFVAVGIVSGYVMFAHPLIQDQVINFSLAILIGLFFELGKKALD